MATSCLENSKHTCTCNMTKTDQYFEELPSQDSNVSIEKTSNLFNYCISMTSFWLVQRQTPSTGTDTLTATPVNNTTGEEYRNVEERHRRRSRKNVTHAINGGYQKTCYTSQIGLIYLKPVVRYSTSVYFHSNNDFPEEPQSPKDIRYDIALVFHSLILPYELTSSSVKIKHIWWLYL